MKPNFTLEHRRKAAQACLARKIPYSLLAGSTISTEPALRGRILAKIAAMPETMRLTYIQAMEGKSPTAAIRSHCLECCGYQRDEVAQCTAPACPLYPYRGEP